MLAQSVRVYSLEVAESCCENPSTCDDEEAYASCSESGGVWSRDDFCDAHPEYCCEG